MSKFSKQEKFDMAMLILICIGFAWFMAYMSNSIYAKHQTQCENRYKNTLQHDIHRDDPCEEK